MSQTRTAVLLLDPQGVARAIQTPAFTLRVERGADRRMERTFSCSRVLIGGGPGADFPLSDPTVSAVHCELFLDGTGFQIRDLGSKNGVQLGARRIHRAWLREDEKISVGESVLRFRLASESHEEALSQAGGLGQLRGSSVPMRRLYAQLVKVAASPATVLIQGESGTGKELVADAIVSQSSRRERPLVVLDCAALVDSLAEAELFGYVQGAFSGAVADHPGAFERANGGTLFLDEVGELPLHLQAKLLRLVEDHTVQRIGGGAPVPIDVRIIASTHHELEQRVNAGTFRSDLFFRLSALQLRVPPLRERREDIPDLVAHFLRELNARAELPPSALKRLYEAEYTGNVRELRNAIERALLGIEDVPRPFVAAAEQLDLTEPFRLQKRRLLDHFEAVYLTALLQASKGNVSEAARRSGLNRVHLYEMLDRHGLRRESL